MKYIRNLLALTAVLGLLLSTTAYAQPVPEPTPAAKAAPAPAPAPVAKAAPRPAPAPKAAPAAAPAPVAAAPAVTPTATPAATPPATQPAAAAEPAEAAETPKAEGEQTWWQALLFDVVFKVLVPIFVPVLAALVFWLARKFGLKLDLETLDKVSTDAANYAEHKAKVWLKEEGNKSSGAQKEDWAWELVEAVDSKLKAKDKARNKLRAMILSKVAAAEKAAADAGSAANGVPAAEDEG